VCGRGAPGRRNRVLRPGRRLGDNASRGGPGPVLEDERRDEAVGAVRARPPEPGRSPPADRRGRGGETGTLLPLVPGPGRRVLRDRVRSREGIGYREAGEGGGLTGPGLFFF